VTHAQLARLGYGRHAIAHRLAVGRLHPVRRGVYAVGRPEITREGEWMAAVLACGPEAVLSHDSAAALWGIRPERGQRIHLSVPLNAGRRQRGIAVHRRSTLSATDLTRRRGIPVTTPIRTLIDLAPKLSTAALEPAINDADKLDLTSPERLRAELERRCGLAGTARLRAILDRRTFRLTDSELERRFLRVVRDAGLPTPQTQRRVNGFRVDFYWPDLGLVVETDGLRYHRTPAEQARDHLRDQAHLASGLTPLRFTHGQIRFEPAHVRATLVAVAGQLELGASGALSP
jgi:very-short-patch-repair endonuclease